MTDKLYLKFSLSNLCFFSIVFFLLSPRFHFFQVPNGTSDFRLDIVFFLFTYPLLLLYFFHFFKFRSFTIIFYFVGLSFFTLSLLNSSSIVNSFFYFLWYSSFILYFFFSFRFPNTPLILNLLILFFFINSTSHLVWHTLDYFSIHINRFFRYGLFELPSPFAFSLAVISFGVQPFVNSRLKFVIIILSFITLYFGESRSAFLLYVLSMLYPLRFKRVFFLIVFSMFFLFFVPSKISFFFEAVLNQAQDPSLNVRIFNFFNYLDWVSYFSFLFGGGALSFLEYSIQYNRPGHLDVLYLKILSDHGLFFLLFILIVILYGLMISFKKSSSVFDVALFRVLLFVFIFNFINEAAVSIKSGHILFLVLGLFFMFRSKRKLN